MQELSPKRKGDISELRAMAKLTELGADLYTPHGENTRSDIIADIDGVLLRLQVKTARNCGDTMKFNCSSRKSNMSETTQHDYKGEIDGFLVFYPDGSSKESFYFVPIEKATKTAMSIRLQKPKNNQSKNINMAENFKLTKKSLYKYIEQLE